MQQALSWSGALGPPLVAAQIRSTAADFRVTEQLTVDFSGEGEHDWLWVEKTGSNTEWLARQLAKHAGVPTRDVGFAGLKDRHAVTRQWFSVRRPAGAAGDWASLAIDGVRILDVQRHRRKLRRGAHTANAFRIVLRGSGFAARQEPLDERLAALAAHGAPNYFGAQRFGRDGSSLGLATALFAGRRLRRDQRSIAISAARSLIFNDILAARIDAGNWDRLLPGDLANLDGSGSVFAVDAVTPELEARCATLDVHPSGTLWGQGASLASAQAAELENAIAERHAPLAEGLARAGVKAASRPLRMRVAELRWDIADDAICLEFTLGRGSYATALLAEFAELL